MIKILNIEKNTTAAKLASWVSCADDQEFVDAPSNIWHEVNSEVVNVASCATLKLFSEPDKLFMYAHVKVATALRLRPLEDDRLAWTK